jgi:hypothetical protein
MLNKSLPLIILFVLSVSCYAQKDFYYGGGIGFQLPSNIGTKQDFGFRDAASIGMVVSVNTLWFYNPVLSLNSGFGYSIIPKDEMTWNARGTGESKVNYQMVHLVGQGNMYFSSNEFRPYIGVVYGLYYLRNKVDYTSKYIGTDNDASVHYISKGLFLGFGFESGIMLQQSKYTIFNIGLRYTLLPNIGMEYDPVNDVTINPHEKQNHWTVFIKFFINQKER